MKKNLKIILGIILVVFMLPTLVSIFVIKNNIDKVNAETTKAGFIVDATNSSTYHIYDADGYKEFVDFVNTEGNNCGDGYTFVLENSLMLKKQVSSLVIEEFKGKFNNKCILLKNIILNLSSFILALGGKTINSKSRLLKS